jgi:hypothetical protein
MFTLTFAFYSLDLDLELRLLDKTTAFKHRHAWMST